MYKCYKYDIILLEKKAKIISLDKIYLKVTYLANIYLRKYGISVKIPY